MINRITIHDLFIDDFGMEIAGRDTVNWYLKLDREWQTIVKRIFGIDLRFYQSSREIHDMFDHLSNFEVHAHMRHSLERHLIDAVYENPDFEYDRKMFISHAMCIWDALAAGGEFVVED